MTMSLDSSSDFTDAHESAFQSALVNCSTQLHPGLVDGVTAEAFLSSSRRRRLQGAQVCDAFGCYFDFVFNVTIDNLAEEGFSGSSLAEATTWAESWLSTTQAEIQDAVNASSSNTFVPLLLAAADELNLNLGNITVDETATAAKLAGLVTALYVETTNYTATPGPTVSPTFLPTPLPTQFNGTSEEPTFVPTSAPTISEIGDQSGKVFTPFDPMDLCPAPAPRSCHERRIQDSALWESAGTAIDGDACASALVYTEDPSTASILQACTAKTYRALPPSCEDVRFHDLAADANNAKIYYTTGHSLRRAPLNGGVTIRRGVDDDLVAGFVRVHLRGLNFGQHSNDVTQVTVKGEVCTSVLWYNSTDLACVVGSPEVLSSPINGFCVSVTTAKGGTYHGVTSRVLAIAKVASGSKAPIVHDVTVVDDGFIPGAVVVDSAGGRLYWANGAAGSLESSTVNGTNLVRLLDGVPQVLGLALHSDGQLYFSDATSGTVRRMHKAGGGVSHVVARGLSEPRGLALDEPSGTLFITDAGSGKIVSVKLDASGPASSPPTTLVIVTSKAQLAGVAVVPLPGDGLAGSSVPGVAAARRNLSKRLVWTESNTDRVRRATVFGTRTEDLKSVPTYSTVEGNLLWPRAVDVDHTGNPVVYVAEYLGRIWEFSLTNRSHSRLVVDTGDYAAALDIRSALASGANPNSSPRPFLRLAT